MPDPEDCAWSGLGALSNNLLAGTEPSSGYNRGPQEMFAQLPICPSYNYSIAGEFKVLKLQFCRCTHGSVNRNVLFPHAYQCQARCLRMPQIQAGDNQETLGRNEERVS